ncbi:MAG: universal stress protein [Acidobacteriota bacterium]
MQTILLPLNLTRDCRRPMRYGIELAAAMKANLRLLHVAGSGGRARPYAWPAEWDETTRASAAHKAVITGRPAERIAAYANSIDADLILMPTRGRGLPGQLLFGSTTMDVLRIANQPLWIAKPQFVQTERPIRFKRVLCGVDLGAEGRSVLNCAARWAEAWDGEILVVHAVCGISEAMLMTYGSGDSGEVELLPEMAHRKVASMAAPIGVPWQVKIEVGDVAEVLLKFAKQWRADVVIVGRGRRTGLWEFGTNIGDIIARSPCPVITVPHRAMRVRPAAHRIFRNTIAFPSPVERHDGSRRELRRGCYST